jgi:hypothetical protein
MDIYTCYVQQQSEQFSRIKRRTSGKWTFLMSGEWSQSPYHQGNQRFYIRNSPDKRYWALLSSGFPKRIIAVAHTPEPREIEEVTAKMMGACKRAGGDYIDLINDSGDLDARKFWNYYRTKGPD